MQYTPISSRRYELEQRARRQRPEYAHDYADFFKFLLLFFYYLFSFVFITDSRIVGVGDTLRVCRRKLAEAPPAPG